MTDIRTRYHASLADEVTAILCTEARWMSSHELLQRCELAKTGDDLSRTLALMVVAKQVQAVSDRIGFVYGSPELAKPVAESDRGSGAPAATAEARESDAVAPGVEARSLPHPSSAEAKRRALLRTLATLFQEQPNYTCRALCLVLNKSQPEVSKLLRHMCEIGQIEKVGGGSKVSFRWLGDPALSAAGEPSRAARASSGTLPPPQPADTVRPTQAAEVGRAVPAEALPAAAEEATPSVPDPAQIDATAAADVSQPAPASGREPCFALFSDGELLITNGAQVTRLSPSTTSGLIQFLRAARGAVEFVS